MCTGVLTKKLMLEFWGDALPNLPQAAREIHERVGVFYNKKTEILPKDAIYELGGGELSRERKIPRVQLIHPIP